METQLIFYIRLNQHVFEISFHCFKMFLPSHDLHNMKKGLQKSYKHLKKRESVYYRGGRKIQFTHHLL